MSLSSLSNKPHGLGTPETLVSVLQAHPVVRRLTAGWLLLALTALALLGYVLGAMIRNESTMVPAHYHGTMGAVTLAYMGFAMIGVQRYPMARDFFNSAIALNTMQLNAYYGLAVALEGLKDMPGAVGAMRSYVHLSKPDDPYLVKANAALWEWEAELQAARKGTRP